MTIRTGTRVQNAHRGSPNEFREGRVIDEWTPATTIVDSHGRRVPHPTLAVVLYPSGAEEAIAPELLEILPARVPSLADELAAERHWRVLQEEAAIARDAIRTERKSA